MTKFAVILDQNQLVSAWIESSPKQLCTSSQETKGVLVRVSTEGDHLEVIVSTTEMNFSVTPLNIKTICLTTNSLLRSVSMGRRFVPIKQLRSL